MPFCLYRLTPLHDWEILVDGTPTVGYQMGRPAEGEVIELDVQWYQEAIAERDRMNGKGGVEQGVLGL